MGTEIRPTRIHRMLNAEPGRVPRWICSNAHEGASFADLLPQYIQLIGIGTSCALALIFGFWIIIPLMILTMIGSALIQRETQQLKLIERKSRARIRRHECLYCGVKLHESINSLACPACSFREKTFD